MNKEYRLELASMFAAGFWIGMLVMLAIINI